MIYYITKNIFFIVKVFLLDEKRNDFVTDIPSFKVNKSSVHFSCGATLATFISYRIEMLKSYFQNNIHIQLII